MSLQTPTRTGEADSTDTYVPVATQSSHAFSSGSLVNRIAKVLEQNRERVLMSDHLNAWTGTEIEEKLKAICALLERTTHAGALVGVSIPNSSANALIIIAALACRRVPVPLSASDLGSDPALWEQRAALSLLFTTDASIATRLNRTALAIITNDGVLETFIDAPSSTTSPSVLSEGHVDGHPEDTTDVAIVLFTSGSTGEPKGVKVPMQGLLQTIDDLTQRFALGQHTVAPIVLPLYHSMALNTQFLPTFLAGGESHFAHSDMSFHRVYRSILERQGTFVALISTVLGICWKEKSRYGLEPAEHVKHVQLAGGTIASRHLEMARELFPNAVIHKGYGLTEAIRVAMISSDEPSFLTPTVGTPLPFVKVELRHDGVCIDRPNQPGEIHVEGPSVLKGFINGKPLQMANGFLPTGDLGYWNEKGELCILGRTDDVVKINGHRVSGFDIEKRALEVSDLIVAAKCLAMDDAENSGEKIVLCLEVPGANALPPNERLQRSIAAIQKGLWEKFQSLRYRPRKIVLLSKLPRTSNGKISLHELRRLCDEVTSHVRIENPFSRTAFYQVADTSSINAQRPVHSRPLVTASLLEGQHA